MRFLAIVLSAMIAVQAQTPAPMLNIVIVEGEGAINNIKLRTARETIVQVEDENHKPVAGAAVVFTLPNQGAGGAFAGNAQTLTSVTDANGRAVARGLQPNKIQGKFQIRVTASHNGQTASTVINMSNLLPVAAVGAASSKLLVILLAAGAAAAGGIAYGVTHSGGGNNNNTTTPTSTTISAGSGSVTPPH